MEVDTGGGEQGSERVQQSSEVNNVPDVSEAHVTPVIFLLVPKLSNLESKQSFHLIASLCTSDMDSDSVVTENQCLAGDHLLYSCDLNVWFRGPAYALSAAQDLMGTSTAVRKFGQSTSSQRLLSRKSYELHSGKKHLELILSLIVLLFLKTLTWNDSN
ncbi:unnamed protein product [Pocillopora meandrina]|uniref:Uncharacterized protein n=1 Tax=Pocillopora meandrina TaxID=46732 RepID=A0AAU9VJM5_9CNID|nr:unnamed protein product [Pocillopora meandrina]